MNAQVRYQKRHRLRKLRGETAYVDATAARMHIASLRYAGWSLRAIGGATGITPTTIARISRDPAATARPQTIAAILAVDPDRTLPSKPSKQVTEPFVSRTGTTRRIQALLAIGWGHRQMREACGLNTAVLVHQQGSWVTRTTHDKVAAMYRDLSGRPGPSAHARTWAVRLGYAGPLDWHDIDHDPHPQTDDDETAEEPVDDIAVWRRMQGDKTVPLTKAEGAELRRRWVAAGRSLAEMEVHTGLNSHRDRGEAS